MCASSALGAGKANAAEGKPHVAGFCLLPLWDPQAVFKLQPHFMHLRYVPRLDTLKIDSLSSFSLIENTGFGWVWGIPIRGHTVTYSNIVLLSIL